MNNPFTIEASIDADKQIVWEMWTEPEHIKKWNFASDDWHCPSAKNDLRVGGKLETRMEAKDGSFGFDLVAIYDDVEISQRLASHLDDGRAVVTTFIEKNGMTCVTTKFEPEGEHSLDMQQAGWQAILNNFKKYTEENC